MQLGDAPFAGGVGAEKLRGSIAFARLGETAPENQRRPRIEAGLGHIEQPQSIGLQLLQPRIGEGDRQGAPHAISHLDELAVAFRDPLSQQLIQHHPAQFQQQQLRQPFGTVVRRGMSHLVAENSGQSGGIAGVRQNARIDPHLAPRQAKGIGRLRHIEDHELPPSVLQRGDCGDAPAHRLHLGGDLGILQSGQLRLQAGELLQAEGDLLLRRNEPELSPARSRHLDAGQQKQRQNHP